MSHGTVVMCLRCSGKYNNSLATNLLSNLTKNELFKSVNICQNDAYDQNGMFYDSQCNC